MTDNVEPLSAEAVLIALSRSYALLGTDSALRVASAIEEKQWPLLGQELLQLLKAEQPQHHDHLSHFAEADGDPQLWKDLLARLLMLTLPTLLREDNPLANTSMQLGKRVKAARTYGTSNTLAHDVRDLVLQIDQYQQALDRQEQAFNRVLAMLVESFREQTLLEDWLDRALLQFQQLMQSAPGSRTREQGMQHIRDAIIKHRTTR